MLLLFACAHQLHVFILRLPQSAIQAAVQQQFRMGATLGDSPLVQHQDLVRVHNCGQPMRYTNTRPSGGGAMKSLQNVLWREANKLCFQLQWSLIYVSIETVKLRG